MSGRNSLRANTLCVNTDSTILLFTDLMKTNHLINLRNVDIIYGILINSLTGKFW
jgi:hypothetical protein